MLAHAPLIFMRRRIAFCSAQALLIFLHKRMPIFGSAAGATDFVMRRRILSFGGRRMRFEVAFAKLTGLRNKMPDSNGLVETAYSNKTLVTRANV